MANVQELVQKLRLENLAVEQAGFFLRTIADGNCGPRAALQSLLIQGFLSNNRAQAWMLYNNICTGHGHNLPINKEYQELRKRYLCATNIEKFINDFMSVYCSPAGDPELRHDGDAMITNCATLLRDQTKFSSEEIVALVEDDVNQFTIGENLNMLYSLEYFKKLGIDLIIKFRTDPNRVQKYEGDIVTEGFKVYIIYDDRPGELHYDVFVPNADLEAYCNNPNQQLQLDVQPLPNLIEPVATSVIFRPRVEQQLEEIEQVIVANDPNAIPDMMIKLNKLFVAKKYQQVTAEEVQTIVNDALNTRFASNDEPIKKLVAVVNEQNKMASFLGCSNSFVDVICDFIFSLFQADRFSVIKKACDTFRNEVDETESPAERMILRLAH